MASKRSEEQIIAKANIEVILGGEKYGISPLVIRDSREWRKKAIGLMAPLPGLVNQTMDTKKPDAFSDAITTMMVTMPDQVLDLFFEYAKDLDRGKIESTATDTELAAAFQEVVKVAFPLASSVPEMMGHLGSQ